MAGEVVLAKTKMIAAEYGINMTLPTGTKLVDLANTDPFIITVIADPDHEKTVISA